MDCKKLFDEIEKLNDKYIKFWKDVCGIESPTLNKAAVDKCAAFFIDEAKKLGFEIDIHKEDTVGDAVCITMNSDSSEKPIAFSGHLDTVHPVGLFGECPVRCDDEKIYGPGVTDCKGGAVAGLMAMEALKNCGFTSRPVILLLQSDEENGSRGSDKRTVKFMCEKSKDAVAFLNCEGYGSGCAILERKGILKYSMEITGKAVHSSACYAGASAIAEAAHKILELEKLKDSDGLTCNCGLIRGGTAENTVPEKCTFTADIRFSNSEQMEHAKKLVSEIAEKSFIDGTKCELTLASYRVAMSNKAENYKLLDKMNEIYSANGMPTLAPQKGSGGSDAADLSESGVPSIDALGVEGGNVHSIKEFAYLSSLSDSAKRIAAIAYCI